MRWLEGPARALTVGFWLLTTLFAWMVSIPFADQQFIQPRLFPDFIGMAEQHTWLSVALLPVAAVALWPALQDPRTNQVARGLLGLWAVVAAVLPFTPGLDAVRPEGLALPTSIAALAFPLGCAWIDFRRAGRMPEDAGFDRTGADLFATLAAAGFVLLFYGTQAAASHPVSWVGVSASVFTHLVVAAAVFLCLSVVRAYSALRERPVYAEFWLATTALGAGTAAIVTGMILPTISVNDGPRWWLGVAFAWTLALVAAARGRLTAAPHADGVLTALAMFVPARLTAGSLIAWFAWPPVIVAVGLGTGAISRVGDWNFLILTLGVIAVWGLAQITALAFVNLLAGAGVRMTVPPRGALAGCLVTLGLYVSLVPPPSATGATTEADGWVLADPSYRTLREALRPPAPADRDFYPFLQRHTNLGPDVTVAAFDIRHAPLTGAPSPIRPHVFLIVVDSLRRDYVSAYNPNVRFTPAIGRFADESVVFERAFTRYGATGLSVPSIWVGGMVPHQQYPKPYAPFNALHALLQHERYQTWISWDNVVDAVVPREGAGPALSTNRAVKDFRFCEMIGDVRSRLDQVTPGGPPVFTWGLPQDIHISAINREGGGAVDAGPYDGFHAPYASRLARLDACFGAFIDDLKARNLYDSSVVILTSDHGDSLGEEGRWGHAYTLFPEVLQVPLIMHVPPALAARMDTDPGAVAYTADITPTLYALLGHQVTPPAPQFGAPLFWPKGAERPVRAEEGALIASSYGSVYGWLTDNGRALYVSDGVSLRDYRYALDGSPAGRPLTVSTADRQASQSALRGALANLARFYHITVPQ
jgi:hypothetical protein